MCVTFSRFSFLGGVLMTFQMIFEQKFPLFSVTEAVYRLVTKMTTQTPDPLHFFQKNIHRMVDSLP